MQRHLFRQLWAFHFTFLQRAIMGFILSLPWIALAQSPLQHLTNLNVLNQNPIFAMTQSAQGMFWLGTEKGLFAYDGLQAKQHFNAFFPINGVAFVDEVGYFTCKNTLYRFYPSQLHLKAEPIFQSSYTISSIYPNKLGLLLLCKEGGVEFIRPTLNQNLKTELLLPNQDIRKIVNKGENAFWAATLTQIFEIHCFPSKTVVKNIEAPVFRDLTLQTLASDKKQHLIIADFENNIKIYSANYQLIDSFRIQNPSQKIQEIQKTENEIFISNEKGIIRYHILNHIQYTHTWPDRTETDNPILSSLIDREQNIWLGSRENGLYRMGTVLDKIVCEGMPTDPIYAIFSPHPHKIWFASGQDLYTLTWSNNAWQLSNQSALLGGNCVVTCIAQDTKGNLWFGTLNNGLYGILSSTQQVVHYNKQNGLNNDNILHIRFDKEGAWICTFEGVNYIKTNDLTSHSDAQFTHFQSNTAFQQIYTYQSVGDTQGNVFFATGGNGAVQFTKGKFERMQQAEFRNDNSFYSVHLSQNQEIVWLSSRDRLYIQKGNQTQLMSLEQTNKKEFQSLIQDVEGNFVLVYNEGIMVMEAETHQFLDYGDAYQCGRITPNINCHSTYGKRQILIGTHNGIIVYTPLDKGGLHQARLSLDAVSVSLNPIDIQHTHDFSHSENHFSFYFTGYWFSDPEIIKYRYRLKGYNTTWIESRDKFAHYPNLAPGDYTFEVQASIHHTFEDAVTIAYPFHISRPIWQRTWFVILLAFILLTGLIFGLREREKTLRKREIIKKQQIEFELQTLKNQINPHFLFNSLNTLMGLIEETPQAAVKYVAHLSDFYRKILTFRDSTLVTLAQEWDITHDYIHILRARFQQNLHLQIEIEPEYYTYKLPSFTLQILLENAVKHNIISQSHPLTIIIKTENQHLIVSNQLQLKKNTPPSTGIGLENIESRCKLLMGKGIIITKSFDTFSVSVPLIQVEP